MIYSSVCVIHYSYAAGGQGSGVFSCFLCLRFLVNIHMAIPITTRSMIDTATHTEPTVMAKVLEFSCGKSGDTVELEPG